MDFNRSRVRIISRENIYWISKYSLDKRNLNRVPRFPHIVVIENIERETSFEKKVASVIVRNEEVYGHENHVYGLPDFVLLLDGLSHE